MTQIIVFGHSITAGFWDTEGGWVQRLRTYLDQRALQEQDEELVYYVYNMGIGGATSESLLERFNDEIERRYEPENQNIILFQIGENDIRYFEGKKQLSVSPENFRKNIEELMDQANQYGEVIFVGDYPADPELEKIPHSEKEKSINDERRQKYEKIKKELCREKNLSYIDLFPLRKKYNTGEMTVDGIHPNNKGHNLIYEKVKERLEEEKII